MFMQADDPNRERGPDAADRLLAYLKLALIVLPGLVVTMVVILVVLHVFGMEPWLEQAGRDAATWIKFGGFVLLAVIAIWSARKG